MPRYVDGSHELVNQMATHPEKHASEDHEDHEDHEEVTALLWQTG